METEHKEGVVEKAVAYVKDLFGIPPSEDKLDEIEPSTAEPEGAFRCRDYPPEGTRRRSREGGGFSAARSLARTIRKSAARPAAA